MSFILSCLRSGFVHSENTELIPTWAGCRALLSNSEVPLMNIEFLPYIPHPVTDYSTVYTALHNFQSVLVQLDQESLPVFCDEGVFRITVDIYFQCPDEFKNLIPMLGGFHMEKAFEHCIGKYMKGSGIEDALVETGVFRPNVVEAVVAGSHCERSLRGMQIIYNVLQQLKWEVFWATRDKTIYQTAITALGNLLSVLSKKDPKKSQNALNECFYLVASLRQGFDEFVMHCSNNSEMCRYWEILQQSINYLQNLIAADGEGDWEGHLLAVQNLLPIFRECDSIKLFTICIVVS